MKVKAIFKDIADGFSITWKASKTYTTYNLLLSFAIALLPIASLWFIKQIIDIVTKYESATREDFIYAIISLVIIQLIQAGLQQALNDIQTVQQQLVIDHLSKKVLEKAITLNYPYYENSEYFNTLHLAQQEVLHRTSTLTNSLNQVMQSGFTMLMLGAIFLQFNWLYGVLVIVAILPVLMIKYKHAKAVQDLEKNNIMNERRALYISRILTDAVHAKEARIFQFGNFFIDKFLALREKIFWGKKRLSANQAWSETIIQAIEIIILAAIIYKLGVDTLDGLLTAGTFIFYLQALQRIQTGFRNFISSFTILFRQRFFLNNIFSFLKLPLSENRSNFSMPFPDHIEKGIILKNVSFTYPDSANTTLSSLNMQFSPGKVTAIIGENGSGKSTLVKLLSRLYTPTSGELLIDDISFTKIDPAEHGNKVSMIFQDYNQYHFSLTDNILLGQPKKDNEIAEAGSDADLNSFTHTIPNGYDTILGKMFGNDQQLSGGQWQKIAIARMLYRNAEIMILDEPTSNIDPLAEYEILQKITLKKKDKIIILITHRLHNLKFADHIYLMNDGKVHGEGTVSELLANNDLFKEMYQRQELEKGAMKI